MKVIKESPLEHATQSSSLMKTDKESSAEACLQQFKLGLQRSQGKLAEIPLTESGYLSAEKGFIGLKEQILTICYF